MYITIKDMNDKKIALECDNDKNVRILFVQSFDDTDIPICIDSFHVNEIKEVQLVYLESHPIGTGNAYSIVFIFNDKKYFELAGFRDREEAKRNLYLITDSIGLWSNDLTDTAYKNLHDYIMKNRLF